MELKMKDSRGDEFGVGAEFEGLNSELSLIRCIAIGKNVDKGNGKKRVARMEWISASGQFDIDQENLSTSYWVKVEQKGS